MKTISKQTGRRFVLGQQGLFPGRRWQGKSGIQEALAQIEVVQIDPVSVIARSHDITLWSRVDCYEPEHLDTLSYMERRYFDYGGILLLYPTEELCYLEPVMLERRIRFALEEKMQYPVYAHVLEEIRKHGAVSNRDFSARERIPGGYGKIKDTGQALYLLWYAGYLMTHSRRRFERIHGLFEEVAQREFLSGAVSEEESATYLALKALRDSRLVSLKEWGKRVGNMAPKFFEGKAGRERLIAIAKAHGISTLHIHEDKAARYYLPEDEPLLEDLERGEIPSAWLPIASDTEQEVNFLAPLDNLIWDRSRLQALFDFEYIWEIYKPAHLRRWGYYTLPILYGDKFVGRLSPKMERKTATLLIEGFWLEDDALGKDSAFLSALNKGIHRFSEFHGAKQVVAEKVLETRVRKALEG